MNPAHYTDPAWAAREARRLAVEEAAALAERYAVNLGPSHQAAVLNLAEMIRALAAKDPA